MTDITPAELAARLEGLAGRVTPEIKAGTVSVKAMESLLRAGREGQRPRARHDPHYEADAELFALLANNLSTLIAALRADQWQPIETAPKGVPVDLWMKCGLQETFRQQMAIDHEFRVANALQRKDGVWIADDDEPLVADLITHWRPLPAPPAALAPTPPEGEG